MVGEGVSGAGGAVLVVVWVGGVSVEDLVGEQGVEGALGPADLVRAERPGTVVQMSFRSSCGGVPVARKGHVERIPSSCSVAAAL